MFAILVVRDVVESLPHVSVVGSGEVTGALSHLDKRNTYVRMLFVDYSSAFNTIVPSKLVVKLRALGLNNSLYSWILDFLTSRRQVVKVGSNISSPQTLSTGAP